MLFPTIDFAIFFVVVLDGELAAASPSDAVEAVHPRVELLLLRLLPLVLRAAAASASIVVNWWFGQTDLPIARPRRVSGTDASRWLVRAAVVVNLAALGFFKYAEFSAVDRAPTRSSASGSDSTRRSLNVHPAGRHLVLHVPGHQLRDRHRPRRVAQADGAARLRGVPLVLRPPGRRSDRPGQRVRVAARANGRTHARSSRPRRSC